MSEFQIVLISGILVFFAGFPVYAIISKYERKRALKNNKALDPLSSNTEAGSCALFFFILGAGLIYHAFKP
jgi:hypothetical protein